MTDEEVIFESLYLCSSRNGVYKSKEFRGYGIKMVNMGELFGYDFIHNQEMEKISLTESEFQKNDLIDGDLIFGRRSLIESGAGKCCIVVEPQDPLTFESSIIRVRLNKEKVNPLFYYYYFKSPIGRGRIKALVSGTNVKGIRSTDLKKIKVISTKKEVQNKITQKLYYYDLMIGNNLRRIELLELSARLLYQEWFVRLRFPGYEHKKIINGVPEEWNLRLIEEIANCIGGGTPSTVVPEYWNDGTIPWVTPTDVTRNNHLILLDSEKKITEKGLSNSSAKMCPSHAILMTSRASVGFFAIPVKEVCTNQGFISIVTFDIRWTPYILFHLISRVEEIRMMGAGSTYPEVSRGKFRKFRVLIPDKTLIELFGEYVEPLLNQIRTLKKQNQNLRTARDLLLPKLISGEITV